METLNRVSTTPELGVRANHASPIVIATDGRAQSDAALVVGRLFAGAPDAFRVVTVLKGLPFVPDAQVSVTPDLEAARRAAARREVLDQLQRTWGTIADVELGEGDPATVIARRAHETGATMIVAGLGRHRVADRVFGDETVLRLIRVSDVPVFAAANGATGAPRRIVVAIDFSETGLRAARMSLELAAPGASIYLTHVAPRDSALPDDGLGIGTYKYDASVALQKTRAQLRIPSDIVVHKVMLQGDPATELLAFATSVNADLIASGSHGHGFVARMLIGSVTTRIVRCSTCSVLCVPYAAVMTHARTTVDQSAVSVIPPTEWASSLDDFTRRNSGRCSLLEVDDPEAGAQTQESGLPFRGATFDPFDRRVDLMFGETEAGRPHLTRSIGGVVEVAVIRDEFGHDLTLHIGYGTGQALVSFCS
jgi:nucleotide-binding universal stress UspA family protein